MGNRDDEIVDILRVISSDLRVVFWAIVIFGIISIIW